MTGSRAGGGFPPTAVQAGVVCVVAAVATFATGFGLGEQAFGDAVGSAIVVAVGCYGVWALLWVVHLLLEQRQR